jgi:hypothetical protein
VLEVDEALRVRNERRLRALGIARAKAPVAPMEPNDVGEAGEPAVIEDVVGAWRVDPRYLGQPFSGRAALLSPFDRLVHDRRRTVEVFGFHYGLEMYKPATKRRWDISPCPSCTGTVSSGSSTPPPTVRQDSSGSTRSTGTSPSRRRSRRP